MKTPDEIKEGLECCQLHDGDMYVDCSHCPYYLTCTHCDIEMHKDALAYIQQLEQREWDLFDLLSSAWHGKQYYFKQEDGSVYSRESCQYLTFDQAIDEFAQSLTVVPGNNEFQYETGFIKGFEAAQPKWISVKERLPEPFVSVLVHIPEEEPLPQVHEGYITPDGTWCSVLYVEAYDRVAHWMPMPEMPEEDE